MIKINRLRAIRKMNEFEISPDVKENNSAILNFIPPRLKPRTKVRLSRFLSPPLRRKSSKSGREEYRCVYRPRFYEVASIIGYSTWSGDGGGRTRIIVSRAIACISSRFRLELEFVIRHAANQRSVADFMEIRTWYGDLSVYIYSLYRQISSLLSSFFLFTRIKIPKFKSLLAHTSSSPIVRHVKMERS